MNACLNPSGRSVLFVVNMLNQLRDALGYSDPCVGIWAFESSLGRLLHLHQTTHNTDLSLSLFLPPFAHLRSVSLTLLSHTFHIRLIARLVSLMLFMCWLLYMTTSLHRNRVNVSIFFPSFPLFTTPKLCTVDVLISSYRFDSIMDALR